MGFHFHFASLSEVLQDRGVVIVDQVDVRRRILMRLGYKNLVVECAEEDCVMLSLDAGYDFVKGVTKRLYIDLLRGKRLIADVCHWGLAEIAALMWLFFRDVDFVKIEGKRYFILTRGPRRRITVEEFERSVPSKLRIN